jgi:integrase
MKQKNVAALTLPPGKRDQIIWDDERDNFGVRLRRLAGGKLDKQWVAQVKRDGTTHRRQFGAVTLVSLTAARAAARKWLGEIATGKDPRAERRERKAKDAQTMRKLVDSYLASKGDEWAAKTRMDITRYLTDARYAGPLLRMPIGSIGLADIAARIDVIKKDKPATAANWRSTMSGFFVWCMRRGHCGQNPVINTEPPTRGKRDRVLTDEEIVAIWNACNDDRDDYHRIVRLLVATACRRDEIGSMRWSELDFTKGTFVIPIERAKTESSARTIPLLPMVREIIEGVPRMATRDYLFGRNAAGFVAWSAAKRELNERCGFSNFTLHDIRRSVATHMSEEPLSVLPHICELVLGHEFRKDVEGRYNRARYAGPIRDAYLRWHAHLCDLISGGERKVVNFPQPERALA